MAEPPLIGAEFIESWFTDALPKGWFSEPLVASVDREEVLINGRLPTPDAADDDASRALAEQTQIAAFREATREARIQVAQRAEALFLRKVSWVVSCGDTTAPFTTLSVPVMTRLRQTERGVLDTLVGSGVARSRSDALGWCVRLVAEHETDWLAELKEAVDAMAEVRSRR